MCGSYFSSMTTLSPVFVCVWVWHFELYIVAILGTFFLFPGLIIIFLLVCLLISLYYFSEVYPPPLQPSSHTQCEASEFSLQGTQT